MENASLKETSKIQLSSLRYSPPLRVHRYSEDFFGSGLAEEDEISDTLPSALSFHSLDDLKDLLETRKNSKNFDQSQNTLKSPRNPSSLSNENCNSNRTFESSPLSSTPSSTSSSPSKHSPHSSRRVSTADFDISENHVNPTNLPLDVTDTLIAESEPISAKSLTPKSSFVSTVEEISSAAESFNKKSTGILYWIEFLSCNLLSLAATITFILLTPVWIFMLLVPIFLIGITPLGLIFWLPILSLIFGPLIFGALILSSALKLLRNVLRSAPSQSFDSNGSQTSKYDVGSYDALIGVFWEFWLFTKLLFNLVLGGLLGIFILLAFSVKDLFAVTYYLIRNTFFSYSRRSTYLFG